MKKLFLLFVVMAASFSVASAQEAGQWTLGPRMNIYANSGDGAVFSLGAFTRYNFTDAWRVEPAVSVLFHSGCSVDIQCDVHYLFEVLSSSLPPYICTTTQGSCKPGSPPSLQHTLWVLTAL